MEFIESHTLEISYKFCNELQFSIVFTTVKTIPTAKLSHKDVYAACMRVCLIICVVHKSMLNTHLNSCHINYWPFYMKHVLYSNNQAKCTYYVFISFFFLFVIFFVMVEWMMRVSNFNVLTVLGKDRLLVWILIGDASKHGIINVFKLGSL